jgi:hypothetical protein
MTKIKASVSKFVHEVVHELKQPQFRPAERKVAIWAFRAVAGYVAVKFGIDIEGWVKGIS